MAGVTKNNLTPGFWYVDRTPCWGGPLNTKFKLLKVDEWTVDVEDEFGEVRTVNRISWESDMEPLRQPVRPS